MDKGIDDKAHPYSANHFRMMTESQALESKYDANLAAGDNLERKETNDLDYEIRIRRPITRYPIFQPKYGVTGKASLLRET